MCRDAIGLCIEVIDNILGFKIPTFMGLRDSLPKIQICEPYVIVLLNLIHVVHEHHMTRLVIKNRH